MAAVENDHAALVSNELAERDCVALGVGQRKIGSRGIDNGRIGPGHWASSSAAIINYRDYDSFQLKEVPQRVIRLKMN